LCARISRAVGMGTSEEQNGNWENSVLAGDYSAAPRNLYRIPIVFMRSPRW